MKLDLSHWNPFKFFRKTPEDKRAEPAAALAPTAGHERPTGLAAPDDGPVADDARPAA